MHQYILRRLLLSIPALVLVSLIIFAILRVMPGDIAVMMVYDPQAGAKDIEAIREELGLTRPVYEQYWDWASNALRGDLGVSYWTKKPVTDEILRRFPITMELAIISVLITVLISIPAGIIAAVRQDSWVDYAARMVSIAGLSIPGFWVGILVVTFGALWLHWIPALTYKPFLQDPLGNVFQLLVPAAVLGTRFSAVTTRITRSSLLEVLRQDYITTALAKGLRWRIVVMRHALKNSFIPTITVLGNEMGYLLGGAVVVESIFSLPGIGRLALESINQRDYPQTQAVVLMIAVVFVVVNLLVDLCYGFLDPRIRFD